MNPHTRIRPLGGEPSAPRLLARLARSVLLGAAALLSVVTPAARAGLSTAELPQVGYHPSGISRYGVVRFANVLWMEDRGWKVVKPNVANSSPASDQIDSLGNPLYLGTGESYLLAQPGEGGVDTVPFLGRIVVTWDGEADIRLGTGSFLAAGSASIPAGQPQSNGGSTGLINNGQRVYNVTSQPNGISVRVYGISSDAAKKPKNIKVWLADPDTGDSLKGQTWHPWFLRRLNENAWGHIRFMDWGPTNCSPQQDWSDRRLPGDTFQAGVINTRAPASGYDGNRDTDIAWEHMIALANATEKDLWINIPHLATNDYITQLARLIRFGSDADGNPYTSTQANPVYPPLNSGLKVFVEFSNEIWSSGGSFAQGDWANAQAKAAGISKAKFTARKFCDTWKIFRDVFGSDDRLVKVAAIHTGWEDYSREFLTEIKTYGATLSPAQEPDLIAPTTYFGSGIQAWAHQKAIDQAGTSDPWFYTTSTFDITINDVTYTRPVSVPLTDSYWTGTAVERHLDATFDEWTRRMLSGTSQSGSGPDNTKSGGGFDDWVRNAAQTLFATPKPIVAYEGGPSIFTDSYNSDQTSQDDGLTNFMNALNRRARFAEVYRVHLNQSKAKGLWSHMMFVDAGNYGKYGQWGHLETSLGAANADSPKYQFILDWTQEAGALRHIDAPSGAVPTFDQVAMLPGAFVGRAYSKTITTAGGDGSRTKTILAKSMSPGLSVALVNGNPVVSGTPTAEGYSYVYVRVTDADGDPAWRVFFVRVDSLDLRRFVQGSDSNGLVSMEAENAQILTTVAGKDSVSRSWELRTSQSDASGGQARKARPDTTDVNYSTLADMKTYSPLMRFNVEFVKSGVHYAHIRAKAEAESGTYVNADSIHVGLDGTRVLDDTGLTLSSSYSWKTVALPSLAPGVHTFDIWMRENGAVVDKIVVSTNSSASALGLTSSSFGPAESSQTGGDVNNGLVARWAFNSNADDSAPNGTANNGALENGATTDSSSSQVGGGSLLLTDSANQRVSVPNQADLNPAGALSFTGWVYPTSLASNRRILQKGPNYSQYRLETNNSGGGKFCVTTNGSSRELAIPSGTFALNTWCFFAAIYDGAAVSFYVNGNATPLATMSATGAIGVSPEDLYIGGQNVTTATSQWKGRIDDLRLYNRALTTDEIATLKNVSH